MPITRKLVAVNDNEENQILKFDNSTRFIVNDTNDWQFLFAQDASFTTSGQTLKIAARFDDNTLNNVKIIAYLYNSVSGSVDAASAVSFNIYKVVLPDWTDEFITTLPGSILPNSYFYINPTLATFTGLDLEGGDTIMIEAVATRLSETYRDRIYVNHLGIYDNVLRLRQDVEFLEITKVDE